jgi:hypothetical protein
MPRSATRKTGPLTAARRPMTRSMLLPLSPRQRRKCRCSSTSRWRPAAGWAAENSHQFNELLRVFYITHQLQEMGFDSLPLQVYACGNEHRVGRH